MVMLIVVAVIVGPVVVFLTAAVAAGAVRHSTLDVARAHAILAAQARQVESRDRALTTRS